MTIEAFTTEKILSDVDRLRYFYRMKNVIRYAKDRKVEMNTESVAEHIYGMFLLTQYFLPLEDPEETLNKTRIYELMTVHDFDEIETGDYLSQIKNASHKIESEQAFGEVKKHIPPHIQEKVIALIDEYETQETPEAKFAKAIDKVEPLIQLFDEDGKTTMHKNKTTAEQSLKVKLGYIESFPFIYKLALTIHQKFIDDGQYWTEGS